MKRKLSTSESEQPEKKAKDDFDPWTVESIQPWMFETKQDRPELPRWRCASDARPGDFACRSVILGTCKQVFKHYGRLWITVATAEDESLAVEVKEFWPHLYIHAPRARGLMSELEEMDQYHGAFWDYTNMGLICDYIGPDDYQQHPLENKPDELLRLLNNLPEEVRSKGTVVSITSEMHLPAGGYRGEIKRPMLKISFSSDTARSKIAKLLNTKGALQFLQGTEFDGTVYSREETLEFQFQMSRDVKMFQGIKILSGFQTRRSDFTRRTKCMYECSATPELIGPATSREVPDPLRLLRVAWWDIETINGKSRHGVPLAHRPDDMIVTNCIMFSTAADPGDYYKYDGYNFQLGITHSSVQDMMDDVGSIFEQCDVVCTYNGMKYDMPYAIIQSHLHGSNLVNLTCFKNHTLFNEKDLEGWKNEGMDGARSVLIPGLMQIDLCLMAKKNELGMIQGSKSLANVVKNKLANYVPKDPRLQNLSDEAKEKAKNKIKFKYSDIRPHFLMHSQDLMDYCRQDVALLPQLADAQGVFLFNAEICAMSYLPHDKDLMVKAQQVKIFNLLCKRAREVGMVISREQIKLLGLLAQFITAFQGGLVLEPKKGRHDGVFVWDFEGLYPSIMMALIICYSTLVFDLRGLRIALLRGRYLSAVQVTSNLKVQFVETATNLLAAVVLQLTARRKEAKKLRDESKAGSPEYALYEQRQLVNKVVCNSAYGATGVKAESKAHHAKDEDGTLNPFKVMMAVDQTKKFTKDKKHKRQAHAYLPCRILAICVTAEGQRMLRAVIDLAESPEWGMNVIYGDTDSMFAQIITVNRIPQNIMVRSDAMTLCRTETFAKAIKFAEQATRMFRRPIKLEPEAWCLRIISMGKKCYSAQTVKTAKYEEDPKKKDIEKKEKGLHTVRGDCLPVVKDVSKTLLTKMICENATPSDLEPIIVNMANQLADNKVPVEALSMTKKIESIGSYKNPYSTPHVMVAKQIARDEPGRAPQPGEMVTYIQTQGGYMDLEKSKKLGVRPHLQTIWQATMRNPLLKILDTVYGSQGRALVGTAERVMSKNSSIVHTR